MPGVGIESAVQKMMEKAAAPAADPKTPSETPASETAKPEGKQPESTETKDEGSRGANGLTTFEQELVDELDTSEQDEFGKLTATERTSRLAWMKRRYRKDARQMTELGNLRKAVKALSEAGVTQEDLVTLVQGKKGGNGKTETATAATQAARGYARLLAQAKDPEERESLREAESVLKEMMEDIVEERLGKRVKPLEEKLQAAEQRSSSDRARTLAADIDALEDKLGYPGSLVETYRETLQREGVRYPSLSAEDLLFKIADPKEIRTALAKQAQKSEEKESRSPALKPSGPIKKAAAPEDLPKKRSGALSIMGSLDRIMQRSMKK